MTMEGSGIVPVMDVNRNGYGYGDGFGCGGGWFMWIIVLFALMGGWGNGFGRGYGNGPGLTQVEMQQGFDTQSILRKLDGIQNGLCDGFYAMNTTALNGFNGVQRDLCTGFSAVNAGIAENRFAMQNCCCETNRNIDAVRAENYRNTCEITNAIRAEGEATRALINHNVITVGGNRNITGEIKVLDNYQRRISEANYLKGLYSNLFKTIDDGPSIYSNNENSEKRSMNKQKYNQYKVPKVPMV